MAEERTRSRGVRLTTREGEESRGKGIAAVDKKDTAISFCIFVQEELKGAQVELTSPVVDAARASSRFQILHASPQDSILPRCSVHLDRTIFPLSRRRELPKWWQIGRGF